MVQRALPSASQARKMHPFFVCLSRYPSFIGTFTEYLEMHFERDIPRAEAMLSISLDVSGAW